MAEHFQLYMITPHNAQAALRAANDGDEDARQSLLAMAQTIKIINDCTREPTQCLCLDCETKFSSDNWPMAFTFMIPMFQNSGQHMVVNCLCKNCFERDDLEDAILRTLRKMWPDLELHEMTLH